MSSSEQPNTQRSIVIVAVALVLAIGLSAAVTDATSRGLLADVQLQQTLGYLVFWVPWAVAVALVYRWGSGIPLRFRWIDVLWGVGIGFVARAVASSIELGVYGRVGALYLGSPTDSGPGPTVVFVLAAVAVPVVLGPVIEELFFRGAVLGVLRGTSRATGVIAVVASAGVFGLMHVFSAATPAAALATGLSTFVFGLGAGSVALTTNRLGGAIISHVVFNGSVVLLALAG